MPITGVSSLLNELRSFLSPTELVAHVANISRHHRIQGTKYLVEASEYIRDMLTDSGVHVEIHDFSYSRPHPWLTPLVGWWVEDGEVRIVEPKDRLLSSFRLAPTAVAAHSPPGEFEGRVHYVGSGETVPDDVEIALTHSKSFETYRKLVSKGAKAVLVFRKNGSPDGIPYVGLFPSPEDLPILRAPVLSISRNDAEYIISLIANGKEVIVKGFVKSGYEDPHPIRVMEAGESGDKGEIHITAHYCHPAGTVNDNVSGAAALLTTAIALSKAVKRTKTEHPSIKFVWFPEHYGSLAYLQRIMPEPNREVIGAINLDMIGERQFITGSTLNFVRPPIHMISEFEAITFHTYYMGLCSSSKVFSSWRGQRTRFSLINYEYGSDHDAYMVYGVSAISLINWPDKYYHSNLDTIEKMDTSLTLQISYLAVKSALRSLSGVSSLASYYRLFVKGLDLMKIDDDNVRELRKTLYDEGLPPFINGVKEVRASRPGIITSSIIMRKSEGNIKERFRDVAKESKWITDALMIAVKASQGGIGIKGLKSLLEAELGVRLDNGVFTVIVDALVNAGVLELI